jgi:long-chain acyl-CoA synthetase
MEKIWLNQYPKDVPYEINPNAYHSLVDMFEQTCAQFADRPAFYNMGTTLTYKQLDDDSRAFAAYLQQKLKLKRGSRVALMMPNILQYPIALYGVLRAGLIAVNVNPLYTAPELIHQLNDSGAETIIVITNFADTVEKALPETSLKNIILTDMGDLLPRPKAWLIHFILKYIKKRIPNIQIANAFNMRDILKQGQALTLEKVVFEEHEIALLQYTGGTTGVAKGAMLMHRNLVANVLQAEAWFSPVFKLGCEVVLTALPLYHIFSLTANCLFINKIGGLNILITNPRDIPGLVTEMKKFNISIITGVNTLFNALLKNSHFTQMDFSKLKICLGGGAPVQEVIANHWQTVTGVAILEAYGLTETSPAAVINPVNSKVFNGAIGLPISSTDVCILDDNHQEVPLDQPGELAIKGPQVMRGYWQNPVETHNVFTKDGWLLTGDIGAINNQGFIRILERKKDMILVSGFNVYPTEIEDTLVHMPGIAEAAVVGVPDENTGEAVKAFIVKADAGLTEADVLRFCHENMTGYKIPHYIEFCTELPKTNVGKILRRALRK